MKAKYFVMLAVTALCLISGATLNVAATAIGNMTDEMTDLFIDLIPLIVIISVFVMILAVVKFRGGR